MPLISDGKRLTSTQHACIAAQANKVKVNNNRCSSQDAVAKADNALPDSSDVKPVSPEVTSTAEESNRKGKTGGTNPPNGSGTTTSKTDPNTSLNNSSKNSQTTLGLFAATIVCGLASIGTHFTNFVSKGPTNNWLAFGADCATTFTGALTLSSLLAPISKDSSGTHHM